MRENEMSFFYRNKNWLTVAALCISTTCHAGDNDGAATRYGILSTNDSNALTFRGKEVSPKTVGNNSLSILDSFKFGDSDVVLVRDDGGDACPAMYYFATVTAAGVSMSGRFGSCSDLAVVKQCGNSLLVTMPDYTGDRDSQAAVAKHICRYRYLKGEVTQLTPSKGRTLCAGA
jgi:hypothetical protein